MLLKAKTQQLNTKQSMRIMGNVIESKDTVAKYETIFEDYG